MTGLTEEGGLNEDSGGISLAGDGCCSGGVQEGACMTRTAVESHCLVMGAAVEVYRTMRA